MANAYSIARPLKLDIVIPTYNRAELLKKALASLLLADRPEYLALSIYVVDNNSKDNTREVIKSFGGIVYYIFETNQGRSHALNAGISAGRGDIVGFIDDDEEVREDWLRVIAEWMAKPEVDFLGGPYLGYTDVSLPRWFPESYCGVIGITPAGNFPREFANDGGPMLLGGNSVIRRSTLLAVGAYNVNLGRTHKALLSCEDEELFLRLLDAGARGYYLPNLAIFHLVPKNRLSKSYFRHWCFWHGVSKCTLAGLRSESSKKLFGVPRYLFGRCLREIPNLFTLQVEPKAFEAELGWWDLAGWLYGAHLTRRAQNRRSIPIQEPEAAQ